MPASPAATGSRRGGPRWLRRALALVLVSAAAVYLVEVVMRWGDLFGVNHGPNTLRYRQEALTLTALRPDGSRDLDGTLYRHKPSTITDFGGFTIATNRFGFRGPELSLEKPAATFRVAVLGDSVVLGWGVDDEATFCRRAEQALNARGDGRRYEVINTGHLAYDSMQEAAVLEREVLALAPDLVVLVFVTNDVVEPTCVLIEALLDGKTEVPGQAPTLLDRVTHYGQRVLPAWTALLTNVKGRFGATGQSNDAAGGLAPEMVPLGPRGWARSQTALRTVRDLCRARALPFVVLDHTLPRLPVLATFCAAEGIPLHDFRFTTEELAQPIYNSLIDTHANARGNQLLADKFLRILERVGV